MKVFIGPYTDDGEKQKIEIQIDEWDTWGMDSTLALIIHPMLIQLKDTKQGIPTNMPMFSEPPEGEYGNLSDEQFAIAEQQWNECLDKMIWAFEQIIKDDEGENQFWTSEPELDLSDYPEDEGKDTKPVRWKTRGELDKEGYDEHHRKIQEGVELFGKHFRDLWN